MTLEEIKAMSPEQLAAKAIELKQAINAHPYNRGQVIEMDEWNQLQEMESLLGALEDHHYSQVCK